MVISKTNPQGLDAVIHKLQNDLYNSLHSLWNIDIDAYPRCYGSLKLSDGITYRTIEHYSDNGEYIDLINAEGNKFFFVRTGDVTPMDMQRYRTDLSLFFTVSLPDIKNGVVHRADEETHNDVLNILNRYNEVSFTRLVTGIDKVYSGYMYKENDDYQPYYCFRIDLDVFYNLNETIC